MEVEQKDHKPGSGLCYICGEIFLLHSAGCVNRENPMFYVVLCMYGEAKLT